MHNPQSSFPPSSCNALHSYHLSSPDQRLLPSQIGRPYTSCMSTGQLPVHNPAWPSISSSSSSSTSTFALSQLVVIGCELPVTCICTFPSSPSSSLASSLSLQTVNGLQLPAAADYHRPLPLHVASDQCCITCSDHSSSSPWLASTCCSGHTFLYTATTSATHILLCHWPVPP
ncbi:hypothetical protein MRB53_023581 [Persea americana]|uniref:Uncharacterized protein n=1 Tax=Persea americana TaxID=3435 RepID=A0ACC2LAS8_PERAE|nr:hypothetical protein MRB53_023581 [Persea americana]